MKKTRLIFILGIITTVSVNLAGCAISKPFIPESQQADAGSQGSDGTDDTTPPSSDGKPDGNFPGGQPGDNQFGGGNFPGGQPGDSQFGDGNFPDWQPGDSQFGDGNFPGGQPNDSQFGDGNFPGGNRPGGNFPGGNFGGGSNMTPAENNTAPLLDTADLFSDRDLKQTADTGKAKILTVSDNKTIDITAEGIYMIKGTASNCTIKVNAPDTAKVQLVLDGVSITNQDFACIYVKKADKVFITTLKNTSTLSVTDSFTADGNTNVDAVIFSKDGLVLNGQGTLNITAANGNGVACKDDLKITGGTYTANVGKHAFEAKDSILVSDGSFHVTSKKDAFHADNSDDDTKGYIYISGGTFELNAGSDGIQGNCFVQIDGGTINITGREGIEGTFIQINGGTVSIYASDDGINASQKSKAHDIVVQINGGDVTVEVGAGDTDCIDSNGCIYVNGGTVRTKGNSCFDYEITGEITGGTVYVNGEQVTEMPESQFGPGGFGGGMRPGGNFGGGNKRPDRQ